MQQEADTAARQFGEELTGETQARFEAARDLALEGESRRRDIDGPEQGGESPRFAGFESSLWRRKLRQKARPTKPAKRRPTAR